MTKPEEEGSPSYAGVVASVTADSGLRGLLTRLEHRADVDPSHGVNHALRVGYWGLRIRAPNSVDGREVVAAALLHDIVAVRKDSPDRSRAGAMSATSARELLPAAGFDAAATARICAAIQEHSYSSGATPTGELSRVLQDADRLEALGAIGIMRAFAVGSRLGAALLHGEDPWARGRALDDRRYTLDHFFVKLFRLPERMHTAAGKAEAARRIETMCRFLDDLGRELGIDRGRAS
jgi:uncharacterized protein